MSVQRKKLSMKHRELAAMPRSIRSSIHVIAEQAGRWILSSPSRGKRVFRTRESALSAAGEAAAEARKRGEATRIVVRSTEAAES